MSKLEYYSGRPVIRVHAPSGEDESSWLVELEGGVLIENHDGRRTAAPELEGSSFLAVRYEDGNTVMIFGNSSDDGVTITDEISLTPHLYSIADDEYTKGKRVFPEAEDESLAITLPEHPDERVAFGPGEAEVQRVEEVAEEAPESHSEAV